MKNNNVQMSFESSILENALYAINNATDKNKECVCKLDKNIIRFEPAISSFSFDLNALHFYNPWEIQSIKSALDKYAKSLLDTMLNSLKTLHKNNITDEYEAKVLLMETLYPYMMQCTQYGEFIDKMKCEDLNKFRK